MTDNAGKRWGARPVDRLAILVIEDNELDARLLQDQLGQVPGALPEVVRAATLVDGLRLFTQRRFDLVVLDLNLPDSQGLRTLRWMRAQSADTPIVVLTAIDDPETAARAIRDGAHDYLVKGRMVNELLWRTLRAAAARETPTSLPVLADDVVRQAEERSRQLEFANRELEAFVHSAAHDLKTPLRTICSFASVLQEDYAGQLDADGADLLVRVSKAAERMDGLLDALLRYARLGETDIQRAPVDLAPIARRIFADLRREDPLRPARLIVPAELPATGDAALLEIALRNLIDNAWKYTRDVARPVIEIGALVDQNPTVYFVRDNGAGFDASEAHKLFSPFVRLHRGFEGTGLGLATVKQIVCRHLGGIRAAARPGAGAAFYFTLEPEQRRLALALSA